MYPLKFEDILRPMIWGGEEISRFKQLPEVHPGIGESWEISQVGERVSLVTHREDKAKTITKMIKRDGANMLALDRLESLLERLARIRETINAFGK